MVALGADGRPEASFGTAGAITLTQIYDVAAVVLDSRGDSYFFGAAAPLRTFDGVVVAVGPDGRPLSGFGTGGVAVMGCPVGDGYLSTGTVGNTGQISAAGVCGGIATTAKFDASGVRDPAFGVFGTPGFDFTSILARPDGSMLFAGRTSITGPGEVVAFSSDGPPLPGFVTASLPGFGPPRLLAAPNGGVYAATGGTDGACCAAPFIVTRLHPDGTVDSGYGQGHGWASVYLDGPGYFDDAAVQPDGSVVPVGLQTAPLTALRSWTRRSPASIPAATSIAASPPSAGSTSARSCLPPSQSTRPVGRSSPPPASPPAG